MRQANPGSDANGASGLTVLRGGGDGARASQRSAAGAGGGALHIFSTVSVTIVGFITANGGGGRGAARCSAIAAWRRGRSVADMFKIGLMLVVVLSAAFDPSAATADNERRVSSDASISFGGFGTNNSLASVAFEFVWRERFHTAIRVGAGIWPTSRGSTVVTEETLELGINLRPSRSLGVLLGWRAGHSYFKKTQPEFLDSEVSVFAFEPVTRISVALGRDWFLRFMPLTMNFYKSRVWGFTVGSEIGIARRF